MQKVLEMVGGAGCITVWIHLTASNCTSTTVKIVNLVYILIRARLGILLSTLWPGMTFTVKKKSLRLCIRPEVVSVARIWPISYPAELTRSHPRKQNLASRMNRVKSKNRRPGFLLCFHLTFSCSWWECNLSSLESGCPSCGWEGIVGVSVSGVCWRSPSVPSAPCSAISLISFSCWPCTVAVSSSCSLCKTDLCKTYRGSFLSFSSLWNNLKRGLYVPSRFGKTCLENHLDLG